MKINLSLLKKPSLKLKASLYAYSVLSRAKAYCNSSNMDLLVAFSFVNKDFCYVLDNIDKSRDICVKLISNKKLTKDEETFVSSAKSFYFSTNQIDNNYFKIVNEYKKEIIPNFEKTLKNIFTNTDVDLKVIFLYQPLVRTIKGSAFRNGIVFCVENKNITKSSIYRLLTHELVHCVCDNNESYQRLYNRKELNLPKLVESRRIFNEVFTETIQNVITYELGLETKLFPYYRFDGKIRDDLACKMEDNIRDLYLKWQKSKSKDNFVDYLNENINKIIKI